MRTDPSDHWVVIPAAGIGRRMGANLPKQYLDLAGLPVIEYSLRLFLNHPRITGILVVLHPEDAHWDQVPSARHKSIMRVAGGKERCYSVLNGLNHLISWARAEDWVLVHDAARPCLRREDLDQLVDRLAGHPLGGLLGKPVQDTMKLADDTQRVLHTVPRERLWHAYTPQMFRLGILHRCLQAALAAGELVTDEASALEWCGKQPLLVEGHGDNIKITRPEDLALAKLYLQGQGRCS